MFSTVTGGLPRAEGGRSLSGMRESLCGRHVGPIGIVEPDLNSGRANRKRDTGTVSAMPSATPAPAYDAGQAA